MDSPLISICIPTYRRAALLREALESVARQAGPHLEVVITEDPSEDDGTERVVEEFRARLPEIRYARNGTRLQFDGNFLQVMKMARGKFCWLLSDDDQLEPGGMACVAGALERDPALTGLTLNRRAYDRDYAQPAYERPFIQREDRLFTDAPTMFAALIDQLGFLSGMVLHRERFLEAAADPRAAGFIGSGYIQLALGVLMMLSHPRWRYLTQRCVGWRRDNDSFVERGALGRLRMDVEGYDRVARLAAPPASESFRFAAAHIVGRHVRHHIVHAKLNGASLNFTREALGLCLRHYAGVPAFWTRTFPILLMPGPMLRVVRSAYQRRKQSGSS